LRSRVEAEREEHSMTAPGAQRRSIEPWRRRLYLPAYTVADAARYARTHPQTVSYWHYGGRALGPALPGKERGKPLSYLQLVEVAFVATFRRLGVSLQRIRRARDYLAQRFESEYPFAEYRLATEGHHVLMDLQQAEPDAEVGRLILADANGQTAWRDVVAQRFAEFVYEYDLALVWRLGGPDSPIVIDPRVAFGAPTVRGTPTWALKGRWEAGEDVDDIQADFSLRRDDVLQALAFEGVKQAA